MSPQQIICSTTTPPPSHTHSSPYVVAVGEVPTLLSCTRCHNRTSKMNSDPSQNRFQGLPHTTYLSRQLNIQDACKTHHHYYHHRLYKYVLPGSPLPSSRVQGLPPVLPPCAPCSEGRRRLGLLARFRKTGAQGIKKYSKLGAGGRSVHGGRTATNDQKTGVTKEICIFYHISFLFATRTPLSIKLNKP